MWATAGGAAETKLVISGRYEDTLKHDDGTWRFVTRKMIPDGWPSDRGRDGSERTERADSETDGD